MAYEKQVHTSGVANQKNSIRGKRAERALAAGAAASFVGGLAALITAFVTSPGDSHGNAMLRLEERVPIDAPHRSALIHDMENWECETVQPTGAFTRYEARYPGVFDGSEDQTVLHETQAVCAAANIEPIESFVLGLGGLALAIGGPIACTIVAVRRGNEQIIPKPV